MDEMNEVMINEDENVEMVIVDEVEEIEMVDTGKGWKIGAAIGGIALAGFGIYKGAKWIAKKIKAKKDTAVQINEAEVIEADFEEEIEESGE